MTSECGSHQLGENLTINLKLYTSYYHAKLLLTDFLKKIKEGHQMHGEIYHINSNLY